MCFGKVFCASGFSGCGCALRPVILPDNKLVMSIWRQVEALAAFPVVFSGDVNGVLLRFFRRRIRHRFRLAFPLPQTFVMLKCAGSLTCIQARVRNQFFCQKGRFGLKKGDLYQRILLNFGVIFFSGWFFSSILELNNSLN